MRGETTPQPELFSYVDLESRIPQSHPIRKIRRIVDEALAELEPAFESMYSTRGRPSIPPSSSSAPCFFKSCSRSARSGS